MVGSSTERKGLEFSHCSCAVAPLIPAVPSKVATMTSPFVQEGAGTQARRQAGRVGAPIRKNNRDTQHNPRRPILSNGR